MKRSVLLALGILGVLLLGTALLFQPSPFELVPACVRSIAWPRTLFVLTNVADLRILVAYLWIPQVLLRLRPRLGIPSDYVFLLFAVFIVSCGLTHGLNVLTGFTPWYWLAYDVKEVTADVSLATAAVLQWVVGPKLLGAADEYRRALEVARSATEQALRDRDAEAERAAREQAARKEAEALAVKLRDAAEREARLGEALAQASAPVLRMGNGILVLVVVGLVTSERVQVLLTRATAAVHSEQARALVIDVSGVPAIDTYVADALGQVARAVGLQGARCILAGISAVVAQTMARMGVRFEGSSACAGDVEQALALAARR